MTYQIIITEETSANIIIDNNTTNVSVSSTQYPITINYNAVIEQAGGNAYGNSNVAAYLASSSLNGNIITSANISGAYFLGNGSQLTGLPATYGNANVAANLAAFGSNPISTTGNITAGYFAGNGSRLTNLTGANVTGTVANATYALTANASTFATQATFAGTANAVAGANVSGTVANATYALNSNAATFATQATFATTANAVAGANVSGTVANATYALNSNAATFAGTVTTAAQPNITSVGILTAINTSGNVSATGNITGSYFLGNGSQLTGLPVQPGTYGNANVAANLAAFATNPISTSGNITAGYFFGNGSQLTGVVSTYGNANVAANLAAFANNPISTTGNITSGNSTVTNTLYVSNITGAAGQNVTVTADGTGDIHLDADSIRIGDNNTAATIVTHGTGNLILRTHEGDASQGNITLVNGVNGNIQLNPNGTGMVTTTVISASGNVDAGNLRTAGQVTATGNITGGNINTGGIVTAAGNILTGNLIIAPGTGAGNIDLVSSQAFATVTTTNNPARIIFGSGYTGNADSWSVNYDPYSRMRQAGFLLNNRVTRGDGAINTTGMTNIFQQEFTANVTTATSRNFAAINFLHVGGGASAFRSTVTSPAAFVGQNSFVQAGTNGNVAVGNTVVGMATGGIFGVQTNSGATIGNAIGVLGSFQASDTTGNVTNAIGFSSWPVSLNTTLQSPTNFNSFYHPSDTAVYGGLFTNNAFRAATNYYAFKNDDNVAQVKLGSLRSYNEFQYSTATSGTVNIDKTNAQVQFLNPTANVTIGDFQNFVTTANDSVNNDNQTDTVTLIIQQGATPYTVTMPTGNASIKYAGGVSTIGTTANAVTVVTVSAIRSAANASLYLASVSSEFS
jgi:hypothetical protein